MIGLPLAFGTPLVLAGLIALPIIWWLLRLTPPKPNQEVFPPLKILARILRKDETPHKSPWWLTLLRLALSALVILALAGSLNAFSMACLQLADVLIIRSLFNVVVWMRLKRLTEEGDNEVLVTE